MRRYFSRFANQMHYNKDAEIEQKPTNTWFFVNGDVILTSNDQEQLQLAEQWIAHLTATIKAQAVEEYKEYQKQQEAQNGRTELSDYEQPELPEVPC
jgi:hypothetical protein